MSGIPVRAVLAAVLGLWAASAEAQETATPWMRLWNGRDLDGWNYLPEVFKVDNGMIVAKGRFNSSTTFCATRQSFSDFELSIRARLWEKGLTYYTNSGIQYRSRMADDARKIMHGYQADLGDNVSAGMFPEGGYPEGQNPVGSNSGCKAAMRTDEFNHIIITAEGGKVTHRLNGKLCLEFTATVASGIIGLQTYLPYGPGSTATTVMEADFKDIYIRPLNNSFQIPDSAVVFLSPEYTDGSATSLAFGRKRAATRAPVFGTLVRGSRFTLDRVPEALRPRIGGGVEVFRSGVKLTVFDPLGHALPVRRMSDGAAGEPAVWEVPGASGGMKAIRISPVR